MATRADQPATKFDEDVFENHKTLLTAKDLARLLAVSEKTVYAWVSDGLIPYYKLQSSIRFDPRAIREWLRRSEYRPREFRRDLRGDRN